MIAALALTALPPEAAPIAGLVAGARVCAVGRMSEQAMLDRIKAAGWTAKAQATDARMPRGRLNLFDRDGVRIAYFHHPAMKQCIVSAPVDDAFHPDDLLIPLTAALGKPPRADPPGTRYLYSLPRLDILTVQIKPATNGRAVELAVVH